MQAVQHLKLIIIIKNYLIYPIKGINYELYKFTRLINMEAEEFNLV